jgi:putative sigma-54 modulation protein
VRGYTCGVHLILSGRGIELDEPLRQYATEKLTRVERFFDRIIKMEVELSHERNRHGPPNRVDVTVKTPLDTLRAHGEGPDHFVAIDKAADRLESQIRRFKDRLVHRSHREHKPPDFAPAVQGASYESGPHIARRSQQVSKPLTPEEARLELDARGLAFLLFTNAESMGPAVIYRSRDGGYAMIEPEG